MEYPTQRATDILVPVDGNQPSFDALVLACTISRRNKGMVYAVYIIEVARTMAIDAELDADARSADAILQQAEQIASEADCKIEGEILQARDAGHAIVDESIERGVSAIFLGVDYKMPLGEFELGETARYVIDHAPCQVILVREAARGVGE
ncbi:MAG TPA: universal stress protein [Dehalococcoidia bacterium]